MTVMTVRDHAQVISNTLLSPRFRQQLSQSMQVSEDDPKIARFARVAMLAIQSDPKLLDADRNSLFLACQYAATDRLMPDGKQGKLITYRTKVGNNWVDKVQWMRMIGGLRVLAARAKFDLIAEVVYANDTFKHRKGTNPGIEHDPAPMGQDRGDIIGFYAIATHLETGRQYFETMTKADVDKVKDGTKSKDPQGNVVGPWRDWYSEQGRKTVAKRLFKSLPVEDDEEITNWISRDNEEYQRNPVEAEDDVTEVVVAPTSSKRPSALQRVVDQEDIVGAGETNNSPPANESADTDAF